MTDEASESLSNSTETNIYRRRKSDKPETLVLPHSEKLSSRQSVVQWFTSQFTYDSPDKIDIILNDIDKKEQKTRSTKRFWICKNLFLKLFLLFCSIYLILYIRPDYSIHLRNSVEHVLKKLNLTSAKLRIRPGQYLAKYRQSSMPIIIIPGIVSTGLELWQGTECAAGKFRHRFWTSMQMVDNIGRDHQCWLKHISLNLSTW
jgi:hypothetical protein